MTLWKIEEALTRLEELIVSEKLEWEVMDTVVAAREELISLRQSMVVANEVIEAQHHVIDTDLTFLHQSAAKMERFTQYTSLVMAGLSAFLFLLSIVNVMIYDNLFAQLSQGFTALLWAGVGTINVVSYFRSCKRVKESKKQAAILDDIKVDGNVH